MWFFFKVEEIITRTRERPDFTTGFFNHEAVTPPSWSISAVAQHDLHEAVTPPSWSSSGADNNNNFVRGNVQCRRCSLPPAPPSRLFSGAATCSCATPPHPQHHNDVSTTNNASLPTNQPTTGKYCTIATTAITIYHTKPRYYHHYLPYYTLTLPSAPLPLPPELSQKTPVEPSQKTLSVDTVAKNHPWTVAKNASPLILSQKTLTLFYKVVTVWKNPYYCRKKPQSHIPSPKWARRYSQSDPTRTSSAKGCACKHKIGTAPQRDSKNQSSNRTLTSASQYEMRRLNALWHNFYARHEEMSPRRNCHTTWCQHSRPKFEDGLTKRAFRAFQKRFQDHKVPRLPGKHVHVSPRPISSNPYNGFCTPLKPSCFAHFRISENRHGTQARTHLHQGPRRGNRFAQAKCTFTISRGTFHREGRKAEPPDAHYSDYTDAFSFTVKTP